MEEEEVEEEEAEGACRLSMYCTPAVVTHNYGVMERSKYLEEKFTEPNRYYKHKYRYSKTWISSSLNLRFP
jgi:hypothetical protein